MSTVRYIIPKHKSTGTQTRYKSLPRCTIVFQTTVGASLTSPLLTLPEQLQEEEGRERERGREVIPNQTEDDPSLDEVPLVFRHLSASLANLNRFVREREADKVREGPDDNRERGGSGDAARCYAAYKLANKKKKGGEFEGVGFPRVRTGNNNNRGCPLW